MAKRDKRYEAIYKTIRTVAASALREFDGNPDGGVVVAGAQAEAFVRTLKGYTLRLINKGFHGKYLHSLFTTMLADVLDGIPHLEGRIVIVERQKAKKK